MRTAARSSTRPDAMADVPGVCELALTGAVVRYGDRHRIRDAGGRIRSIGLALVLEGEYAASSEVLDLGSGDVEIVDLGSELVILDWVYEPTLDHVRRLLRRSVSADAGGDVEAGTELERYCFRLALTVLERLGFTPLTRPTLLRIGFRDISRDLDLHDLTSVRVVAGRRTARIHLDYEGNALLVDLAGSGAEPELERGLERAFPSRDLRRTRTPEGSARYQVRFPLAHTFGELREELAEIREGLLQLIASFEPERRRSLDRSTETFGVRSTLDRLSIREPDDEARPLTAAPGGVGSTLVH